MASYEELLNEAYKKVKVVEGNKGERFEIPRVQVNVEGNRTIIINFSQIISYLRREPDHFQKFLFKELATPGKREGDRLILNRKLPIAKINEKIEQYTKQFVICRECGKPDTQLITENRMTFIHCLACGAKHSVAKI